ncbi:MAG TPA: NAD(P)-binding domain-containing protein [Noviherbaspirillum sp.]|uniref:flavin-containing monooxygenase n=1 Tax=Noviherbaspirillum sp. TaxID=1926288 RepID=UPI002DDCDA2B|nr:NAD(P)-binding domain-containing protein [Noviherbaspirillum sp.]HEV2611990.1 NAD(P)-binding domain-containing protein [Noviherbaspirillum sp.]
MAGPESLPVCIVGAGSSGVAAAKALKEKGIAFECFELGSDIGGMWRYENDNGLSSAYRSLHIDTSRNNLGYSDFPIAGHYPDFLSHYQVMEHLEAYAERFGVRPHIRFRTRVEDVRPAADGAWDVRLHDSEVRRYRAVLVANGHLWDPRYPDFPGSFSGTAMHSHYYRTAEPFRDKNVLIVGIGNSAVDIAVDVCKTAKSTTLSTRRSAWIMPKYIMGIPTDRWSAFFSRKLKLPTRVTRALIRRLMFLAVGDQARYGVPRPTHSIWQEHATLSQELLPYVGHGWIRIAPNVKELRRDSVAFENGQIAPVDAIIYATGYRASFPFIDPSLFEVRDGSVSLYRRMLPPHLPGLYMVGLVQPIGPTIPLVEIQARWLASVLAGETALPGRETMEREIALHARRIAKRYVGSARYTLEVDFREYAAALRKDMQRRMAGT